VGIRIPNHNIPRQLVRLLGNPILTTSIKDNDEVLEYSTDPELIFERYKNLVDIVIDGGSGNNIGSTIIDCTNDEIDIVREGLGDIEQYL
jgi:tRNA A37 threonylcarbamoyladenosine synthetase subunit TsaC/SUA5/YrdC